MSQPLDNKKYEELNDFPEKVILGNDSDHDVVLPRRDDVIDLSAELEEILFLEDSPARPSDPIVDESPALKKAIKKPDAYDVELLASEIDSLGQASRKTQPKPEDSINDILGIEDLAVIDDLSVLYDVVKSSSESELGVLEPVSELSTGEDRAFLIQDQETVSESVPLWKESDDFRITEVEGIDGVTPDSLMDYFHARMQGIDPISKKVAPSAAPRRSPVDSRTIRKDSASDDISIPFIDIISEDLPDAIPSSDDEIEMVVFGDESVTEKSPPEFIQEIIEPKQVKIPDSFTLKPMDLNEAERIAREEIVIINEDDLIEELESMDLLPVSEHEPEKGTVRPDSDVHFEYVTPAESAIDDSHRKKIEDEVESDSALIIEEDVQDIRQKLETTAKASSTDEEIIDITDHVIIIDDAEDMDRFVASIPEAKREDMKRLLRYLDGLFEKLPEDVVKRFADSEYFDLYVRIMNELEA